MPVCGSCNSPSLAVVSAKCSDMCYVAVGDKVHDGYVPKGMRIDDGTGDYVDFTYCTDCGQIQGRFPIAKSAIRKLGIDE